MTMYMERKVFSKGNFELQGRQVPSASTTTGLALNFLLTYCFSEDTKFIIG